MVMVHGTMSDGAVVFGDGGHAVAGFASHLAAEVSTMRRQVLAGEDGVVHHQVADRMTALLVSAMQTAP